MSTDYAYGREQIVFVKEEAEYGTLIHPEGTDAIKVLSCGFTSAQERKDRLEKGSSRSLISRFTGRKTAEFTLEKYILPSGTLNTPPDDASLWKALFGTETVNGGVVYSLLAEPAVSLSLFSDVGPHREALCGFVTTSMTINWGGGDEPKVSFSGPAKDHYLCGSDVLTAAAEATTTIEVTDALQYAAGMLVKVGDDDNSGDGFTINSIAYDTNILTLSAAVTDEDIGAAVVPLPLTSTTAGDVIPVIVGTVKFGTTTLLITGCSFTVDQKVALRNDEFGVASASGFRHPEFREVNCSLDMYFKKGEAKWLNDAKRFSAQDIEVVLGDTEGKKLQIDANQVEFEIPNIDVPDTGECTISLAGKCLGSSGEDELVVSFL